MVKVQRLNDSGEYNSLRYSLFPVCKRKHKYTERWGIKANYILQSCLNAIGHKSNF
jgi:hypothetical protein